MKKETIGISQIEEFIDKNKYPVGSKPIFSRCIDGRYDKVNLEPLAKPGADIGDLMTLFAANKQFNLGLKDQDIFKALIKTVGGYPNLRFHTDSHNLSADRQDENNFLGCGHFKQARLNPETYGLTSENILAIDQFLLSAVNRKAVCEVLSGEHNESAVIILKGDWWSVSPIYKKENSTTACFIYHKTLDNKRRRKLAENLLPFIKLDADYLYQILTKTGDDQLLETVSRLAPSLPVFEVEFKEEGSFKISLK